MRSSYTLAPQAPSRSVERSIPTPTTSPFHRTGEFHLPSTSAILCHIRGCWTSPLNMVALLTRQSRVFWNPRRMMGPAKAQRPMTRQRFPQAQIRWTKDLENVRSDPGVLQSRQRAQQNSSIFRIHSEGPSSREGRRRIIK